MEGALRARLVTRRLYPRLAVAGVTVSLVLMAFAIGELAGYWPDSPLGTDFVSYWTGAILVRDGAGPKLYDMDAQRALQQTLLHRARTEEMRGSVRLDPYHSPPPLALLFVPLTLLPPDVAYLLWSAFGLLAGLGAVTLTLRGYPRARAAVVVMLTFGAVIDNGIWGQVDTLFLLAFSLSLLSLSGGRPCLGGGLLGLLWLKPQYAALFALVFLVKGRWRELAGMSFVGIAVAVTSWAMIGTEGALRYLEVLQRIGSYYPPSGSFILPEYMINWRAVLMNLFPSIPGGVGSTLVVALGAVTGFSALLALQGDWAPASARFPRQMLVVTLAAIVATPHSHLHGASLLLAPLSLALSRGMVGVSDARTWSTLLASGYLLGLVGWPFGQFRWLLAPYFIVVMVYLIAQDRRQLRQGLTTVATVAGKGAV